MKPGNADQRQIYQLWLAARRKVPVPEGFSGRVMDVVQYQADRYGLRRVLSGFHDLYLPNEWPRRLALLGSLFALGVFRFAFIAANLVFP